MIGLLMPWMGVLCACALLAGLVVIAHRRQP
jgi:hypothetical protein